MGASGWHVVGAMDADLGGVIERLREQVFVTGDYHRRWESFDREMIAAELEEMIEVLPFPAEAGFDPVVSLARLRSGEEPASIDEATFWAGPDGTHSVLDVSGVDPSGGYGTVRPLGSDELAEIFGDAPPTSAAVDSGQSALSQRIERHTAVAFEDADGRLHVAGVTGD